MDFNYKQLSYGQIISHVFPGFVFLFLLVIHSYAGNYQSMLKDIEGLQWNEQGSLFIIFIFVGTITGVLIDATRHFIEDVLLDRIIFKNEIEKMEHIFFQEEYQVKAYIHFVHEDLFYYYEAYGNLIIATIPVYWLIPLFKANIVLSYIGFSIFQLMLLKVALYSYQQYISMHNEVINVFKMKKSVK